MKKFFLFIIILALIGLKLTVFFVDQTQYAIVFRFGDAKKVISKSGLNFKLPNPIEEVKYFDNRILDYDSAPTEVLTADKKNLLIDNYAKWKIFDIKKFFVSVGNEYDMDSRLDDIVYSKLREELGKHELIEIVDKNKEKIMDTVTKACNEKAKEYGVQIIDVRIKRADLPKENEQAVYNRMITERERIAKEYRSEGEREKTKIVSNVDRKVTEMKSKAIAEAQQILGDAEQIAIKTYADAYKGRDKEKFFEFLQKLELIKETFNSKTKIILTTDSEVFDILNSSK